MDKDLARLTAKMQKEYDRLEKAYDKAQKSENDYKGKSDKKKKSYSKATEKAKDKLDKYKEKLDETKDLTEEYIKIQYTDLPKAEQEWQDMKNSIEENRDILSMHHTHCTKYISAHLGFL